MNISKHLEEYYANSFAKYNAKPEGASWGSDIERVNLRWKMILSVMEHDPEGRIEKPTVLDVGCSYGGMLEYAKTHGICLNYSGIDIVKESIESACCMHQDASFYCGDILNDEVLPQNAVYDYVVSCGTFAIKGSVSHRAYYSYWKKIIKIMFSKCRRGIAFNVFPTSVNIFHENAFYVNSLELLAFCSDSLSDKVLLNNATKLFDTFVFVYKNF